jgi:hypothetical protein
MVVGRETRKHGKKKKQWLRLRGIICAILFFLVKIEKRIPMYFTSSRVIAHAHALALPSSSSLSPTLLSPSIPTATTSSQCWSNLFAPHVSPLPRNWGKPFATRASL